MQMWLNFTLIKFISRTRGCLVGGQPYLSPSSLPVSCMCEILSPQVCEFSLPVCAGSLLIHVSFEGSQPHPLGNQKKNKKKIYIYLCIYFGINVTEVKLGHIQGTLLQMVYIFPMIEHSCRPEPQLGLPCLSIAFVISRDVHTLVGSYQLCALNCRFSAELAKLCALNYLFNVHKHLSTLLFSQEKEH